MSNCFICKGKKNEIYAQVYFKLQGEAAIYVIDCTGFCRLLQRHEIYC